jgi:hybrid cluster-associated redox disulfide protein
MANKKITKDTTIAEAISINENVAEVLFEAGMMCVGCAMAHGETIEQGCLAHRMSKKDIKKLIEKLNEEDKNKGKKK